MLAAVQFDFDPTTSRPSALSVRLETLALAGVVFLVLVLVGLERGPDRGRLGRGSRTAPRDRRRPRLRRDDLILIAFGAVPGAVVGGRLGYALIHLDYYAANPARSTDPARAALA